MAMIDKMVHLNSQFTREKLQQAIEILENSSTPRTLADVLVKDMGYERHGVMQTICKIYAFREIKINASMLSEGWIDFIQNFYKALDEKCRENIISQKIVPFGFSDKSRDLQIFITPDPTVRDIDHQMVAAGIKRYELAYARLEDVNELLAKVSPSENEFLKIVHEFTEGVAFIDEEGEEGEIDEDELHLSGQPQSIGQSVRGMSDRSGAQGRQRYPHHPARGQCYRNLYPRRRPSDDMAPSGKCQAGSLAGRGQGPDKNVDRFEWEMAQDGFIQREIDKYLLRFRVSILPIVSPALSRKYESVVIRVLDDRKVITDLSKLGFDGYAKSEFLKAIRKPQGMVILTGPTGSGKSTTPVASVGPGDDAGIEHSYG